MNEDLRKKLDLLAANRKAIHEKFCFDNALMSVAASFIFTVADSEADMEKMTECKKILNKETSVFSKLKKTVKLVLLSKMTLAEDPEAYINDVEAVYKKIRQGKFSENPYMALAAMIICDIGIQNDCDEIISRADEIMKRMDKDHPFLTSSEDTSFVMLLALSYKDVDTIINELDEAYDYIKNTYKVHVSSNAVQGLCEVLTLSYGEMKAKCDKAMKIYSAFSSRKIPNDSEYIFSAIGALIDVDQSPESLADEILEADAFLKEKDGFREKGMEKNYRMMYSALVVADVHGMGSELKGNPFISNTLSIIQAEKAVKVITFLMNAAPSVIGVLAGDTDSSDTSDKGDTAVAGNTPAVSANSAEKKEG